MATTRGPAEEAFRERIRDIIQASGNPEGRIRIKFDANGKMTLESEGMKRVVNKALKDLANAFAQEVTPNGELWSHGITYRITGNGLVGYKYKSDAGAIANAKGRLFENAVFDALQAAYQAKFGQGIALKDTAEADKQADQYAGIKASMPELDKIILDRARTAANALIQGVSREDAEATILTFMAGSDTAGDLKMGDTMLELKFSKNKNRVKYFTLSDLKNFGKPGLIDYSYPTYSSILVEDNRTEKTKRTPTQAAQWVTDVRTLAFQSYVNEVLGAGKTDTQLFEFLMAKGNAESEMKKKIVLGIEGNATHPVIVVDADAFNQSELKKTPAKSGDAMYFTQNTEGPTSNHIAFLTTEKESVAKYSMEQPGSYSESAVNFLFYLQAGFFSKGTEYN